MMFIVREFEKRDVPAAVALWNDSATKNEVIYSPITEKTFAEIYLCDGMQLYAAEANGQLIGFIHGTAQTTFLPNQTNENTPGYLTFFFVTPAYRHMGVGTALVTALEEHFRTLGKKTIMCSDNNPALMTWRIPNTPGHDHNKAPGMDEACAGYPMLQALGYAPYAHEIAMYMNFTDYQPPKDLDELREALAADGIYTGRCTGEQLDYDCDALCDHVGSEYWRDVMKKEIAAWKAGKPVSDPTLWPDGRQPAGPRPIIIAAHDNKIIGFTGPVDKQNSGRGWFTGICVDPNYGKRGIATVLFNLLMQEFEKEGAAFTTLYTGAENRAQRIYMRAGLHVVRNYCIMKKAL